MIVENSKDIRYEERVYGVTSRDKYIELARFLSKKDNLEPNYDNMGFEQDSVSISLFYKNKRLSISCFCSDLDKKQKMFEILERLVLNFN